MLEIEVFTHDSLNVFSGNISFSEAEFERACELLAWRDPQFCELHLECARNSAARRFDTLRDSDPFIAETAMVAETPDVDDERPTVPDVDEEADRPTNPIFRLLPVQKAA